MERGSALFDLPLIRIVEHPQKWHGKPETTRSKIFHSWGDAKVYLADPIFSTLGNSHNKFNRICNALRQIEQCLLHARHDGVFIIVIAQVLIRVDNLF